jgi:hypothetical protein
MSSVLFANPITFDIQISLTLFDKYKQVTRRGFYLRNLSGETEAEQVTHAQQILDSVAEELYYLTRYGIDKGVIKVDKKKVAETIYTDYAPHETAQYFRFGVTMTFFNLHTYLWAKKSEGRQLRTWRLAKNQWDEGWERIVKYSPERKTLRFPCLVNTTSETDFFFQYRGIRKQSRKIKGWLAHFDRKDEVFHRFINRFSTDGNLSFGGEKRYWSKDVSWVDVKGVNWPVPNFKKLALPSKSKLASQPRDETDYVYLIRMGRNLIFKIGKSNDPKGRLASLQTASPYKLKITHLFKADNASAAEETLHRYFHEKRLEGEWFKLSQAEKDALEKVSHFEEGCFVVAGKQINIETLFSASK